MSALTADITQVITLGKRVNELPNNLRKRAYFRAARDMSKELVRLHLVATQTWKSVVVPKTSFTLSGSGFVVMSTSDNEIFSLLTVGAKPHEIVPVNAPALVFPWGGVGSYIAKSQPGTLAARAGSGRNTGDITYRGIVNHPGFPGREYHELIAEEILPFAVTALATEIGRELARL